VSAGVAGPVSEISGDATDLSVARSGVAERVVSHGGLVVGFGPDFHPLPAGVVAAQGGDGVGAALGPAHPGQLESLADDGLAAGLDGTGSDEHAQFAEPGVAHPLSVGLEVAERLVDFAGLDVGEGQVSGGGGQGGMSPASRSASRAVSQAGWSWPRMGASP